ncbi:MAG: twin-arginine translocase subunit TatC [Chitinophagaceae bacterium]|nr:twin-arginine translocase subunit TatC [Chitinophagaceae bacterium]
MAVALFICSVVAYIYIGEIFDKVILAPTRKDFPSYIWLCKLGELMNVKSLCLDDVKMSFQNTQLSGQFMMSFSASFLFGFIISFPYLVWELWRFIRPALTARELQNSRGIIFWISLLFFCGVWFGYFIITPYTVNFFAAYTLSSQFQNIIKIDDYLDSVMNLVLGTGIVFELPVAVYFLSKLGMLTPAFMREYRKYAIVIILIVAAVITPPDAVSQIIVTIPLWILYELSIVISGRVQKERIRKEKEFFSN